MLTTLIALATIGGPSGRGDWNAWVGSLRAPAGTSTTAPDGTVERVLNNRAAEREADKKINEICHYASGLIERGRSEEAYRYLAQYELPGNRTDDSILVPLIECAIFSGHNDDAYRLLLQRIAHQGVSVDWETTELSLLTALKGRLLEGQSDYTRGSFERGYRRLRSSSATVPRSTSQSGPKAVATEAALALGFQSGRPVSTSFLELALKLDPSNAIAAEEAISQYQICGRHSDASRIAKGVMKQLPAGPSRESFEKALAANAGVPDRPLEPLVRGNTP